jgi:hypothetical protein
MVAVSVFGKYYIHKIFVKFSFFQIFVFSVSDVSPRVQDREQCENPINFLV